MKNQFNSVIQKILIDLSPCNCYIISRGETGVTVKFKNSRLKPFTLFLSLVEDKIICVRIINLWTEKYLMSKKETKDDDVFFTKLNDLSDIRHYSEYWEFIDFVKNLSHRKYWIDKCRKRYGTYYWWDYIRDWFKFRN